MITKLALVILALAFLPAYAGAQNDKAQPSSAVAARRKEPVKAGELAPDFTLEDFRVENEEWRKVTLSSAQGQAPVVLAFYRGHWCSYCMRQLSDLRKLLKPGEDVRLYAISIDNHADSKKVAEKIASDGKGQIAFPLLSDWDSHVVDAYGLRDSRYRGQSVEGVPIPAVYVIDKAGRVAWVKIEIDYRNRPTNKEIRAALDALK